MKKIFIIVLIIMIIPIYVDAKIYIENNDKIVYKLRAGDGSYSGGSTHESSIHSDNSEINNPIEIILYIIPMIIIVIISSFIFYFKILRSSINSKKYLKILGETDITWEYKNIEEQAKNTFYIVQDSWTKMDLTISKDYITNRLYNLFNKKIETMKENKERNILKKIKLLNIKPISIHDDENNTNDSIWFYIKGFMIDYKIDEETQEKISGSKIPTTFVEFWKFKRNENNKWLLDIIKQKEEIKSILKK